MSTSKDLKSQATNIKRTVTGIRNVISWAGNQQRLSNVRLLSEADLKLLDKAAAILNQVRNQASGMSTKAAGQEHTRELALKKATDEATKLFAQWPAALTTFDKIALIVGNGAERLLREDIAKERVSGGWAWTLNYWHEEARREIPGTAAYIAVADNKPVADLMLVAADRLAKIKANPGVELLAARWQVKLDQETKGVGPSTTPH